MTKQVWKYPLGMTLLAGADHDIPRHAQVLCVQLQNGYPCIWVTVDPKQETILRQFRIFRTGHNVPTDAVYIGTYQEPPFVWHVFEVFD